MAVQYFLTDESFNQKQIDYYKSQQAISGITFNFNYNDVLVYPDGKINFTGIYKTLTNGDLDTSYQDGWYKYETSPNSFSQPESTIFDSNGDIYVAGGIIYSGESINNIYKIDGSTGYQDNSFDYTYKDGQIKGFGRNSIDVDSNNKLYVGGLADISPSPFFSVQRLDTSGNVEKVYQDFSISNDDVKCIKLSGDTKLYVGGNLTSYSGTSINKVVLINTADGTIDTSFSASTFNIGAVIQCIDLQPDGKILLSGNFSSYDGNSSQGIVRLNTDGSYDSTFQSGFVNVTPRIIRYYNNKIYVASYTNTIYNGEDTYGVIELDLNGNLLRTIQPNSFDEINAETGDVAFNGDVMYVSTFGGYKYYLNDLQPWCSLEEPYTITESTCNNPDGIITIPISYLDFYNFTLEDYFGNNYPINTIGQFTGLTSQYYKITAVPITSLLRDTCVLRWIPLRDSDTDLAVTGTTISDAICGSFNQQEGRFVGQLSGATEPYEYYLWNEVEELVTTGSTSNPLVIEDLVGSIYYLLIDDGTCRLLYDFKIQEDKLLSVPNIKEIYVTEWFEGFDWNYWSTENDADYFGGLDTLKFQSTKIKEFTSTGLTWFFIPVDDVNVSFNQALSRQVQGFIFTDQLTVGIPYNDEEKWKALTNLLTKKYVVVFKDNNDYWWTFGFQRGADVSDYTFSSELGGFTFSFTTQSENKILTSIDENYVENNIK